MADFVLRVIENAVLALPIVFILSGAAFYGVLLFLHAVNEGHSSDRDWKIAVVVGLVAAAVLLPIGYHYGGRLCEDQETRQGQFEVYVSSLDCTNIVKCSGERGTLEWECKKRGLLEIAF